MLYSYTCTLDMSLQEIDDGVEEIPWEPLVPPAKYDRETKQPQMSSRFTSSELGIDISGHWNPTPKNLTYEPLHPGNPSPGMDMASLYDWRFPLPGAMIYERAVVPRLDPTIRHTIVLDMDTLLDDENEDNPVGDQDYDSRDNERINLSRHIPSMLSSRQYQEDFHEMEGTRTSIPKRSLSSPGKGTKRSAREFPVLIKKAENELKGLFKIASKKTQVVPLGNGNSKSETPPKMTREGKQKTQVRRVAQGRRVAPAMILDEGRKTHDRA